MTSLPDLDSFVNAVDLAAAAYTKAVALPWPAAPQAAILDPAGEIVAATSIAAAGGLARALGAARTFFGSAWQPGDVAITNDQDAGATTACQFTAIVPVWSGADEPVLWAALRAFLPDCGGWEIGGYSPQAVDRWAEGARFEAAKFMLAGRVRREIADMLMLNSRTPKLVTRCMRQLATAAKELGETAGRALASSAPQGTAALADALMASEIVRIDEALSRLARRGGEGAAPVQTPFPDLKLGAVNVSVVPANDGLTVALEAPPVAPRPVNLAPGMAADIASAAVAGALGLGALRTGALRRRLKIDVPSPSLAAAPLPTPVGLGPTTTGAAVFAATVAALGEAGATVDGAALWRDFGAANGGGAPDPVTGKITPQRAAAIRAREAEEAAA
ncbi:MAG: hydantoinase B/oxoprolinase family protein [Rhodospirillaceae bacterium]|nr:hydantoinase B/oxoprolinase family protein [Rhodospirillaceae bacterium]